MLTIDSMASPTPQEHVIFDDPDLELRQKAKKYHRTLPDFLSQEIYEVLVTRDILNLGIKRQVLGKVSDYARHSTLDLLSI